MFTSVAPAALTADKMERSELVQPLCGTGDTRLNPIPEKSCFLGTRGFTSPSHRSDLSAGISPLQELHAKPWSSVWLVLPKTCGNPPIIV